jgi:dTDP-4-dehydrorhamnose reductase
VIRTNIYGFNYTPANSLVEWALKNLVAGRPITGFTDVWFNPLYTRQLARAIDYLARSSSFSGVINIAAKERVSKFDFLVLLAQAFRLPPELVRKGTVDSVSFSAPRPRNTYLNTEMMEGILGWGFSVKEGIDEMKNDYMALQDAGRKQDMASPQRAGD